MRFLAFLCVALLHAEASFALTVELNGYSPNQLPVIDFPDGSDPLPVTIDVRNELTETSEPIFVWQLAFVALPVDGAVGELMFTDIELPLVSLFGTGTTPGTLDPMPSPNIVASDVDFVNGGTPLDPGKAASIALLHLSSNGANGTFLIAAVPYAAEEQDSTSFWADPDENILGFSNAIGPSQLIELALVNAGSSDISSIGDYNGDGEVDAADYTVWRDGLGEVYDSEHYDRWRTHFGASATGLAAVNTPEGTSIAPLFFATFLLSRPQAYRLRLSVDS